MTEPRVDLTLWPKVIQLAQCLCDEVEASGYPVCYCTILPGATIAHDYCGECSDGTCGMAWVRVNGIYASTQFPFPAQDATCATMLAVELEVGIARCAPMSDGDGTPPPIEDQMMATQIQMADMHTMHRALACCFADTGVIAPYTPFGPEGGCVGGTWGITISED